MPRGTRKSTDEQISEIDLKIQELQSKKKELLDAKEQEDIRQLLDAAKESGLTPADLVKKLTVKTESEE